MLPEDEEDEGDYEEEFIDDKGDTVCYSALDSRSSSLRNTSSLLGIEKRLEQSDSVKATHTQPTDTTSISTATTQNPTPEKPNIFPNCGKMNSIRERGKRARPAASSLNRPPHIFNRSYIHCSYQTMSILPNLSRT